MILNTNSFWKKALLINLAVISAIVVVLAVFFATPSGRPIYKTILLVTEAAPGFPVRPMKFLTRRPSVETVKIAVSGQEIEANLYRPKGKGSHPAIIFTLGTLYRRDNPQVVKFAQALSGVGFVVLVPDLPDFLSGFVWTDSVNTLVSSVEYLDKQGFVKKDKIGFAGFCVGASAAMIAAEDEKIADKVAYIAAISPYFEVTTLTKSALTGEIVEGSTAAPWDPARLTVKTVYVGYLNYLTDENERQFLLEGLDKKKIVSDEDLAEFSENAMDIYYFLTRSNRENFDDLKANLPDELERLMTKLSPSTNISNLHAKVIILNDKKDTFVPKIEGERLTKALPKGQVDFIEVDSFEHVNPATRLERWAAIRQLWHLGQYIYNVMEEVS